MARLPAAHGGDHPLGVVESQRPQRRHRARRCRIIAAEIQFRDQRGGFGGVGHRLEQLGIAGAHGVQMVQKRDGKARRVRVAHERREPRQLRRTLRQRVRLAVGHHLQTMFHAAQEEVRGGQFRHGGARNPVGRRQPPQCPQRRGIAQRRVPAAPDELESLRQELDLADAALAQLDVVPGDPRHGVRRGGQRAALVLVDPALHRVDVGHQRKVEPAAPDEGTDRVQEQRPQRQVAGHRACLDHGGTLPALAHAFVIGDCRRQRDRGRGRRGVGAQPQIGAEHVAVGVPRLHQRHQGTG